MSEPTCGWPKCEECGERATVAVADLRELPPEKGPNEKYGSRWERVSKHYYCETHRREPRRTYLAGKKAEGEKPEKGK